MDPTARRTARRSPRLCVLLLTGSLALALPANVAHAQTTPVSYAWPVNGAVIRGYQEPGSRYGPGHRGIDIAAAFGTPVRAAADGVVAFAGFVAGSRFVSIDHPDGIRTTYSWLSRIDVRAHQTVARGAVIGATGHGHPEIDRPHLHFGARRGSAYLDPMILLGAAAGAIHLAPLDAPNRPARWAPGSLGLPAPVGEPTAAGLPPRVQAGPFDWLWSRTEPKPWVLPGRARPPPGP